MVGAAASEEKEGEERSEVSFCRHFLKK